MDTRTIESLLELAASLRSAPHPDAVLRIAACAAAGLTASAQCTVRLLDATGTRLLVAARSGPTMHTRGTSRFRVDQGFQGWVIAHREPAYSNEPGRDPRFEARAGQKWMPTAIGAVPLVGREGVIGVLAMTRADDRPYDERDLALLRLVAELLLPHVEMRRLEWVSLTDPLTHLLNRRALDRRLELLIREARSAEEPLSAILLDLDRFGAVNNRFGLDVGDDVLVRVAERLRDACRQDDPVFRWGGEEFLVLLPGATIAEAHAAAERMRRHLRDHAIESRREPVSVTGSFGVATLVPDDTAETLFRRLDVAVKCAKKEGRDRVRPDLVENWGRLPA